jgi:hypothetical protein
MKHVKIVLSVLLIATLMVGLLAGCSVKHLNGTYKSTGSLGETLTFTKDQKVTGELLGFTIDGEYEIKDDTLKYKSSPLLAGIGITKEWSFKKDGNSIWIDGQEYVKQK